MTNKSKADKKMNMFDRHVASRPKMKVKYLAQNIGIICNNWAFLNAMFHVGK